jgi:HSP20 family protein
MTTKEKSSKETRENIKIELGFGGLFKGLESIVDMVGKLAESESGEIRRETTEQFKSAGGKEIKAVYGVSVRTAAGGKPKVETFGNVHEREEGQAPIVDEVREPMVDLFEEKDHILVIAELPGVGEGDVRHELSGDILTITAESGDRKYHKEMLLPEAFLNARVEAAYRNGVLELKIWKPR